jgi:hypothetical protein
VRQPSGADVDDTKGNHRHSGSKLFAPIKGIRSLVGKKRQSPTPSRKSPLQQSEDMKKEPSADDIATVCAFSGTNAGLAARYLKVSLPGGGGDCSGVRFDSPLTDDTRIGERQQCRSRRERHPRERRH